MSEDTSTTAEPPSYSFHELCTPHYSTLVAYAQRLLNGRGSEARDLVQEAYLRAFRTWGAWKPRPNEDPSQAARGWLHRIVQNVFLDEARSRTGHRKALEEHHGDIIESTYGVETDHNIQLLSDGVGDEVRDALAELEEDHREVVIRADFSGQKYLHIASALGIPLGTVMSRLHRGRKKLATTLQEYARESYGISRKALAKRVRSRPVSDCADTAALPDVTAETPEPEPHSIDSIVAGDDGGDFL